MTPDRWERIEALFLTAVELEPAARGGWLDRECAGDAELRTEINRLLASDTNASPALQQAVARSVRELENPFEAPVKRIGPYEILAEVGRGGMGVVYRARRDDDVFRKEVALKVVKRGMDTDQILSRFQNERRILARLEHASIARILDGGSTESGLPYLVMEFVEGLPLTEYAAKHRLSLEKRLILFCGVCAAVEYAHQNLVVHRDLKPSNILVTDDGTPKLLDFGIAKLLNRETGEMHTLTSADTRVLTPQYASPEQVAGEHITTASDIYSLGTILYELLSGKTAHHITTQTPAALHQAICEDEVVPPSKLAVSPEASAISPHELAGDLDNIVMMALRKDRHERYGSVRLLSDDLQRYLKDLPILARPQTIRYRTVKFLRRHRFSVIAASLAAASLIGGAAFSLYQARRADRRFQEVRTLAHAVLFDIHDQIENLPGATAAREVMVQTVLRYLNSLSREAGDDPSLQWELAVAYQKVGDVQGYGFRPNLGQLAGAMDSHSKALDLAEKLAARGYDPKVQKLLAVAHHRMGIFQHGGQSGIDAGMEHYARSLEILERLNRESPGNPEIAPLLLMVYGHQGDAHVTYGRIPEAAASWLHTLVVAEEWHRLNPSVASTQALANAHRRASRASQMTGDLDRAVSEAEKAIAVNEPLASSQPSNVTLQRDLLNSYEQMSFVAALPDYLNLGDRATALKYTQMVNAIAQGLVDADPKNKMAGSDLVIALRARCLFLPEEDPNAVIRGCQDLMETADRVGRSPAENLPTMALRSAPALLRLGKRAEALSLMQTGIDNLKQSTEKMPWRPDVRLQLMRLHMRFGAMLTEMGRPEEAVRQYQAAKEIGEAHLATHAKDLIARRDLADCYASLGRHYEKYDRLQAKHWYGKDLEMWTNWPRFGTSGRFDQARREIAVRNVARCGVDRP